VRSIGRRARRFILGIAERETTVARRGFNVPDDAVRERLEEIGRTFVEGYHAALEHAPEVEKEREQLERDVQDLATTPAAAARRLLRIFLGDFPSG